MTKLIKTTHNKQAHESFLTFLLALKNVKRFTCTYLNNNVGWVGVLRIENQRS
jgi:hypothetical protein